MNDTTTSFHTARAFLQREGRLLERRLFATLFERAPADGVLDALRGYRNTDGGFGHGLEPDKLCPASLPIDVDIAFQVMNAAGNIDRHMIDDACEYLVSVSRDGGVALADPVIERYPRAEHWTDWTYQIDLNPTAGLTGLLHKFGVDHPWVKAATTFCWDALDAGLPTEAHALGETLVFLEHVPDRDRAEQVSVRLSEHLPSVQLLQLDPHAGGYGVSPLQYAPRPDSPWRGLFSDELIEGHLDRLAAGQQDDGGWPIAWNPPAHSSTLAWRGIETLRALRVLAAYGRLTPASPPTN